MAKSPRKAAGKGKTARPAKSTKSTRSAKSTKSAPNHPYGGKNLSSFKNRRFSIISSSDSDSYEDARPNTKSDSDSSLTEMSENDEQSHLRKGSVFFQDTRKPGKSTKKTLPKKTPVHAYSSDAESNNGNVVEFSMEDDDESEKQSTISGLDAMLGPNKGFYAPSFSDSDSDSNSNDNDDDDENSSGSSSSDDSEVDFVRLQAERRARSRKSLKNPLKNQQSQAEKLERKRRKSDFRRKSEVALPEDINFKFESDNASDHSASSSIEQAPAHDPFEGLRITNNATEQQEEEDLGEEIKPETSASQPENLNVQLDEPLLDVPKIKDDELNSDDEYEFDDNDLLATLQADNDLEDFINGNPVQPKETPQERDRQSSISSFNEDETMDPFLEEEEKYLVNEFEQNGFDDENEDNSAGLAAAKSINEFHKPNDMVVQYQSHSERGSDNEDDDGYMDDEEEDDVDDYIDFIDFDNSLFNETGQGNGLDTPEPIRDLKDLKNTEKAEKAKKAEKAERAERKQRQKRKALGLLEEDEDDDLYLWNYFFSSGEEGSPAESDTDPYDVEEQLILEEIFRQEKEAQEEKNDREFSLEPENSEQGYDSGESTDVDLLLPPALKRNQVGSKMAKEVLSSKTADYRPPVLGTWVAIESKPFGIIDGLSTRLLNSGAGAGKQGSNLQNSKNPRGKGWKSIGLGGKTESGEDLAIELDELLNISELDNDDENDIRIWRDFNNRKQRVPLGAFRNKSHLHHPVHIVPEPMSGFSTSKMKKDFDGQKNELLDSPANDNGGTMKQKRRKASIADAVSEGYRPTKSGLFSENVLNGVEELLGDDKDFMALIKGL